MKTKYKIIVRSFAALSVLCASALSSRAQVTATYSSNMLTAPIVCQASSTNLAVGLYNTNRIWQSKNLGISMSFAGGSASNNGTIAFQFAVLTHGVNGQMTTTHPFTLISTANGTTPVVDWGVIPNYTVGPADAIALVGITNAAVNVNATYPNHMSIADLDPVRFTLSNQRTLNDVGTFGYESGASILYANGTYFFFGAAGEYANSTLSSNGWTLFQNSLSNNQQDGTTIVPYLGQYFLFSTYMGFNAWTSYDLTNWTAISPGSLSFPSQTVAEGDGTIALIPVSPYGIPAGINLIVTNMWAPTITNRLYFTNGILMKLTSP